MRWSSTALGEARKRVYEAQRAARTLGVLDRTSVFGRSSVEVLVELDGGEILKDLEIFPRQQLLLLWVVGLDLRRRDEPGAGCRSAVGHVEIAVGGTGADLHLPFNGGDAELTASP